MASTTQSGMANLPMEQSMLHFAELVKEKLPALHDLIKDDMHTNVDHEHFFTKIVGIFKESHPEVYDQVLEKRPKHHQDAINKFFDGRISADEASDILEAADTQDEPVATDNKIKHPVAPNCLVHKTFSSHPEFPVYTRVKHIKHDVDIEFENWGKTINQTPAITFYPENVEDVKAIVSYSVKTGRGVRVSGYRHSWAPLFGRNEQQNNGNVMIAMLSDVTTNFLPNFTSLSTPLFQDEINPLKSIDKVDPAHVNGVALADGKQYIRVGAATTNERFRRWCLTEGQVTLPMNIIEVEITMGGANAPICHGAGLQHATLSDLVRAIEYVDVNGEWQKVDMSTPDLLKAAAGCFGLLGVVTHITYECDPIATAVMRPIKMDVIRAIPPPPEMKYSDIPEALRPDKPLTEEEMAEEMAEAQQEFERRANSDYYAEWFWFPYSNKVWVNTWSIDKDTITDVVEYPVSKKVSKQVFSTIALNIAQIVFKDGLELLPEMQTAAISYLAMKNLPEVAADGKPIRTLIPNALHFQRGVTNIRVRDLEVEFPLQAKPGTTEERDYTNVQRAWWQAILACYAKKDKCPQRMPLEMRIMGSSEVTMAPQRGHKLGTCSIEILTLHAAAKIWKPYAQEVLDQWMSLKDADGKQLMIKPHWAKEWNELEVRGKPWPEILKTESYAEQIPEFKSLLAAIGKKHGWTLEDIQRTFSNDLFDYLFFDDIVAASPHPTILTRQATMRGGKANYFKQLIEAELIVFRRLFTSLRPKFL